jgi:cation diffusion facilitator family transporter
VDSSVRTTRLRAGQLSLGLGVLIFLGKLAVWRMTLSTAVMSDAIESSINILAAGLLLFALAVSARPADRDHPYGHGKVEFFSAGIEGTFVLVAGLLVMIQAARDLMLGTAPQNLDIGLVLLSLLSGANGALGVHLVRTGRETQSLALEADGRHILADVWTSGAILLGLLGIWLTGWTRLDPLMAFGAGANILREGWGVARRAVSGLMDEADPALLARIVENLAGAREDSWIDLHALRTWRSGAELHVDGHLTVPRYLDVERLHHIHDQIQDLLTRTEGRSDVVVHFDPCTPRHCSRCRVDACPVREAEFVSRAELDLERATRPV